MAIDRALSEGPVQASDFMGSEEIEIQIENPDAVSIETEDGGVLIDFDPEGGLGEEVEFGANLSEHMEDTDLETVSSDLIGDYLGDRSSRKDWEESYIKGLSQLGLKIEDRTAPWEGACGVTHPILSEAVVRFQSQAISEIFPRVVPSAPRLLGS